MQIARECAHDHYAFISHSLLRLRADFSSVADAECCWEAEGCCASRSRAAAAGAAAAARPALPLQTRRRDCRVREGGPVERRAPGRRQQARQTWWATNRSARARPEPPTPSPPSPPPPSATPPSPSRRHRRHSRHRRHFSHSRRRRPRPPLSPPPVLAAILAVSAPSRPRSPSPPSPPPPPPPSPSRRRPRRAASASPSVAAHLAASAVATALRPQRLSLLATTISAASLTAGGFTYLCEKRGCASAAALPVCMCMHVHACAAHVYFRRGVVRPRVAGSSPAARSSVRAICVRALVATRYA